jgi:hypothetical protein
VHRPTPNQVLGAPSSCPCSSCKFFFLCMKWRIQIGRGKRIRVLINWHLAGLLLFFLPTDLFESSIRCAFSYSCRSRRFFFSCTKRRIQAGRAGRIWSLSIGMWHVWRSSLSSWSLLEVLMVISRGIISTVIIGLEPAQSWKLELSLLELMMRLQLTSRRYLR